MVYNMIEVYFFIRKLDHHRNIYEVIDGICNIEILSLNHHLFFIIWLVSEEKRCT
jgi:hypothetical protein